MTTGDAAGAGDHLPSQVDKNDSTDMHVASIQQLLRTAVAANQRLGTGVLVAVSLPNADCRKQKVRRAAKDAGSAAACWWGV